jgi:hypothetical protein
VSDANERAESGLPRLGPGSVFAGYRIEGLLDRGGMGVVYKAVDVELERTVALKIIAPEHTQDATAVARFKAEARLAASLEHPNIVPIHRGGEEHGILYLAMRFVPGTNLREVIDRGPIEFARIGRIVTDVADALDAAHGRGLVHRDVKPANILVSGPPDHEHVYLTDFGLTKRLGSTGDLTQTGSWVGTPDYVAPEQIRGRMVDGRADVYSLGCVLYEMLTGHVAYPKDSDVAKLWAHVSDPPPLPRSERRELVEAFDAVVGRATAKDPEDRFASAGELAAAVRRAVAEQQLKRAHEAAQATELESGLPAPAAAAAAAPAASRRGGLRSRRAGAIALLVLLACAVPVAIILLSNSSDGTSSESTTPGQLVDAELAQVPFNHVDGVGKAVVRLNGSVASVALTTEGLVNLPHPMHIHAGAQGTCPGGSAARFHNGRKAISATDGGPYYGKPVISLTRTGDTSAKAFLRFKQFPSTGNIRYHRPIDVGPAVAATIRAKNAVIVVHGVDYDDNGTYNAILGNSEFKGGGFGEQTAPALCGPLVPEPAQSGSGGKTKTGQVPRRATVYTATLQVMADLPRLLCDLGAATHTERKRA